MAATAAPRPRPRRCRCSSTGSRRKPACRAWSPVIERDRIDVVSLVRRLDWFLMCAVAALVAYGLWAVAGITRYDVEGNESYYVVRQAISAGIGFAGFLLALAIDPD